MTNAKGIDVSVYQNPADWSTAGLSFLIARASIGTSKDGKYDSHIAKARAAGLVTGAYHFNWDGAVAEAEARAFLKAAGDVDLYFLDVEGNHSYTTDQVRRFVAEVHKAGKKCGLYMSASPYKWGAGQDYDWVAQWATNPPAGDWEFWQYRGSPLDLDQFNGDAAALRAFVGEDMGGIYEKVAQAGTFKVTSPVAKFYKLDANAGFVVSGSTAQAAQTGAYDHYVHRIAGTGPTTLFHVTTGPLAGQYLSDGDIAQVPAGPPTPPTTYTQAQVDAITAAATAPLSARITDLAAQLAASEASAITAASTEKDRIAASEAARIKAL